MTGRRDYSRGLLVGLLILMAVVSLLPMTAVFVGSLRSNAEIMAAPVALPTSVDLSNYVNAWTRGSMATYFGNSLIVTLGALCLSMAVALPASYALGRWVFRGRAILALLFAIGLMVPLRLGVVPLFRMFNQVGLTNSLAGLMLIYAASAIPMAVLVLSAFYSQLPDALEHAALVDGAGHRTIWWSIMTPLVRPAIAAVLVLNVGPIWNDFFMPLIFLRDRGNYTLPVGITSFFSEHSSDRGLLYAGIIITIVPVVAFFALAMRQIVAGLTAGIEK